MVANGRVLHVSTVVAIKYYYGISVIIRYVLNVLVDDASECKSARPWNSLNECLFRPRHIDCLYLGTRVEHQGQEEVAISKGWLVRFSEQESE